MKVRGMREVTSSPGLPGSRGRSFQVSAHAGRFGTPHNARRISPVHARTAVRAGHPGCEPLEQRLMMAASALYPALTLDPADRLMNSRVLGEWNTDGNSDSWQVNNVSSW